MLIRWVGKWLGRLIMLVVAVGLAGWVLLPREGIGAVAPFDPGQIGPDLDAYLAAKEGRFDDIVPGTEARIVWAGETGAVTPWSVVYLHGFSASSEEIRPVPDRVAEALGANLLFARFAGHGRDAAAMSEPSAADWIADTAEALAIARRIGDRVLVIATSTGGSLAVIAAADPAMSEDVAGLALISPNFRLRDSVADAVLALPGIRYWGPLVAGRERAFQPVNEGQARYWTERYATIATLPMGSVKRAAFAADHGAIEVPALFVISEADKVVSPQATRDVAAAWGGSSRLETVDLPPGSDPYSHLIAGDIMSPAMTEPVTALILDWATGL